MRRRSLVLGPALLGLLIAASCGQEHDPAAGLMLAITSDGPLPIDRLELRVSSKDRVLRSSSYRVPEEAALPTTLAIATNGDSTASVNITVVGWNGDVPLDRRDAIVTQVPTDRLALLPVVLSGRCSKKVTVQDGEAVSTCGEGSTCDPRTGDCTSAEFEGTSLGSYNQGDEDELGLGGSSSGGASGQQKAGESSGGSGAAGGQPATSLGGAAGETGNTHVAGVCETTYRDCNNQTALDGCEVDIDTDPDNCGACQAPCSNNHGDARCEAGECQIDCKPGFADCNDDRKDGCEADLTRDAMNCSKCEKACPVNMGGSPWCREGACGETVCPSADLGDCNGEPEDDCEIDISSTPEDCGTCGHECSVAGGQAGCESGACTVESCDGPLKDCVNGYADGCETNTAEDAENCGACGKPCLTTAGAHVVDNLCVFASCEPTCAGNYGNCDSNGANGCEQSLTNDSAHCGACNKACAKLNASATTCSSGVCTPTCNAGWGACSNPEAGCTTPLGTVTNCTACGNACGGATPYCQASGCSDHLDIVVLPGDVHKTFGGSGGAATDGQLMLSHTLVNARDNGNHNRMLLVGLVATDAFLNPSNFTVTYGGTTMTRAASSEDATHVAHAAVYYLLDSQMPATAGAKTLNVSLIPGGFTWGAGGASVLELANVSQGAVLATGNNSGANCGASQTRAVTVNVAQPGSLVFALLAGRGATSAPLTPAAGLIETWNEHQPTPDHMMAAAAHIFTSATRTVTWNVANCYASAQVGVAIKRIGL